MQWSSWSKHVFERDAISRAISRQEKGGLHKCLARFITYSSPGRSALVNIRRKGLLSSVGFRKRVTSRSPRCISCMLLLRSSTLICLMIWCLFRGLVLVFRSSPDWLNQEDATASVWKWCFNVSPRSSLLAHGDGPFTGCYWVTSLQWPRIEWHSRRITQTSK